MVLTPLHYAPSAIAALLTIAILFERRRSHKGLGIAMVLAGALGFLGYISGGNLRFYPLDFHVLHSLCGLAALLSSAYVLADRIYFHKVPPDKHCLMGYAAAILAAVSLLTGTIILTGQVTQETETHQAVQEPAFGPLPEVEAAEYLGVELTPLRLQGNNAIQGTQHINRTEYRLNVFGLVDRNLSISYEELLALPAYSEVAYMPCVEGWGFNAKWTGFRVTDLLNLSGLKPSANYVVFHTVEGYSTGLPLDYLRDEKILMAYGINDLTLPTERGYPLQLVAKDRYGYKWAKWITDVEVTDSESRGYWESRGYSNSAKVGEFPFG
jgi:DMSO/TMAO reductase YedYZ molybdopterin-dependent catalytic subunit